MTWVKLDDGFFRNRKSRAVGKAGRELYLAGLCYCAGTLTDGFIPTSDLPLVVAEAQVRPALAKTLVDAGMWAEVDGGWMIPDYLVYNPTAEKVRREREEGRKRAAASAARKGEASGEEQPKNPRRNGEASDPPSRPSVVKSVGQSSSVVPAATTTDELLEETWKILAERDHQAKLADTGQQPRVLAAWLKSAVDQRRSKHEIDARRILELEPAVTAAGLADTLDGVRPAGVQPRPYAEQERCEGGCSNGSLLDDAGLAYPCPVCRQAS